LPARVSISPFQLPACPPASLLGLNKGLTLLNCPALAGGPVGCRRGVQGSGFLKMAANPTRAGSKKCEVDVNTLLQKLQLNDAERDGVVLAKEERENLPKVKWLAVAKLLTVKQFSDQSLSSTMMAAWNPTREVTFRPIARNLYMVQASCLGDWKRIMEDGPWLFRGCALMLEEYDGGNAFTVGRTKQSPSLDTDSQDTAIISH